MSNILILTDLHIGRKNFDPILLEETSQFLDWSFSVMDERNVSTVILNGDTFDNRKHITTEAHDLFDKFRLRCYKYNRSLIVNLGNHDLKDQNDYSNTFFKTFEKTFELVTKPTRKPIHRNLYGFVPYTYPSRREEFEAMMEDWDHDITFTHNYFSDNKTEIEVPSLLCVNGHIHSRGSYDNVYNLGTGYQMGWDDVDQDKFVHIIDQEGNIDDVQYPRTLFKRLRIVNGKLEDENPLVWLMRNKASLENHFIYVYFEGQIDQVTYDKICSILNNTNCHDIKFSEHIAYAVDVDDGAETDALTALKSHMEWSETQLEKIDSLYNKVKNDL